LKWHLRRLYVVSTLKWWLKGCVLLQRWN